MYKPKLKYVFCLMRKRSLMPAMSLMRYMNSVGIIPQLLISSVFSDYGDRENQHSLITKELNQYKVKYNEIKSLPNFDIMFSEGHGFSPFEKHWMTESKRCGKTNVMLINNTSPYRNLVNIYLTPENTKLLDGVCLRIEETVLYYKEFTKGLFLINVGDPDWDWWKTDEFEKGVEKIKSRFGDKILVMCDIFCLPQSIPYTEILIAQSKKLGFKFMINPHPDRWPLVPKHFHKYCDRTIHHHILFKAASHVISTINCSVVIESLLLGTKVGCDPMIPHYTKWGKHGWLDKETWFRVALQHVKQEIVDMVSPIFDKEDLNEFLLSSKPKASPEETGRIYGKINVPYYAEYLFKTLEERERVL